MNKEEKWFKDNFVKPIEDEMYQARLDKVLSKFDKSNDQYYNYNCNSNYEFMHLIIYFDVRNKNLYIPNVGTISLKTVESLIKDLEANNEA